VQKLFLTTFKYLHNCQKRDTPYQAPKEKKETLQDLIQLLYNAKAPDNIFRGLDNSIILITLISVPLHFA